MNNEKKKFDAIGWKSYCSRLCCGTARSRRWASVRAGRARRARQLGAGAGERQGAGRAAGRWARGRQALGARGARGLGAWAGLGQCTRCTRPIFDPF